MTFQSDEHNDVSLAKSQFMHTSKTPKKSEIANKSLTLLNKNNFNSPKFMKKENQVSKKSIPPGPPNR